MLTINDIRNLLVIITKSKESTINTTYWFSEKYKSVFRSDLQAGLKAC